MAFMTIYNAAKRYKHCMIDSYGKSVREQLSLPYGRKGSALLDSTPNERDLVTRALDTIDAQASKFKGLSAQSFCFGVTNSLLVAWIFGALPEHFWIVYILEIMVLFPLKFHITWKAKQHFYWLDFCWVANILMFLGLLLLAFDTCFPEIVIGELGRKALFCMAFGIACGPLVLAAGVLGNALIFHDIENTSAVLIHLVPSLLMYTLRWKHEVLHETWPDIFQLDYLTELDPWKDIFMWASLVYTLWLILYSVWLISHGMNLPKRGYDTIFHYLLRGGLGTQIGKLIGRSKEEQAERASNNDFKAIDLLVYMLGHAVAVYIGIMVSLMCFETKFFHGSLNASMALMTIYNGAKRYKFYMVDSYGKSVREEFSIPRGRCASALSDLH
jgi:hypothetical protein